MGPVPVPVLQPWYCETCGAQLSFEYLSDQDASVVKEGVLRQHRKMAPQCTADSVPPIRFRERERTGKGNVSSIMD